MEINIWRMTGISLLAVILLLLITGSLAWAKSYEISDYDVFLEINEQGDFLITEIIEYNFLEGTYTQGFREVAGRGFAGVEFVSLESPDTEITAKLVQGEG